MPSRVYLNSDEDTFVVQDNDRFIQWTAPKIRAKISSLSMRFGVDELIVGDDIKIGVDEQGAYYEMEV